MVISTLAAITSSLLYFYMSFILLNRLYSTNTRPCSRNRFLLYVFIAATLQLFSFASTLIDNQLIMLSLGSSLSLITWLSVMSLLSTTLKQPTEKLGIFLFPLAGLTAILTFIPNDSTGISIEVGIHIILSISAYSILGLATAQAILYSIQERKFREKKLTSLFKALPPLQIMESIMVQFITIGFVILTLSLATGAYFLDDIFAQHLVHKTFFGVFAWLVYATFLVGHYRLGWRGQTATKFAIWAYLLLVLSYIGTEFILTYLV